MELRSFFEKIKMKLQRLTDKDSVEAVDSGFAAEGKPAETDAFTASLNALTPDGIAPPPEKKRDMAEICRNIVRYAAMAVFGCVFVVSAFTAMRSFVGYRRGDEIYGDIADNIFDSDLSGKGGVELLKKSGQSVPLPDYYTGIGDGFTGDEYAEKEVNAEFEQMKANLTYLRSQNPDIYGYIHIDGTNISYPIVQGEDNEYYLNRTWNGEYVVVGSIYADFRAEKNLENNRNTVFYGHNMRDGKMFNNVMNFLEEDVFYNKNILIYTFDGAYTFEPFAIFQTVYTFPYFRMDFADDDDFIAFCEEMQEQSVHSKELTFTGDDTVITLSTCTPSDDPSTFFIGRYALHARLVKVES